jgi:DNA-binding HxlR family transcriptional regulator
MFISWTTKILRLNHQSPPKLTTDLKNAPTLTGTGAITKVSIGGLNKLFNHRSRMGIMAILMVNDWADFVALRDTLKLTDGSLASHLKALVKEKQIEVEKKFVDDKPKTSYRATAEGQAAFEAHLAELEEFIKLVDN